jgi:3-hydroxyacyl-CoA dehydrogenase
VVDLSPPADSPEELEAALAKAVRKGRAGPNVVRAIALIQSGVAQHCDDALRSERAAFDELRVGAEARNLRYLFFARRAAAKALRVDGEPLDIREVGVVGAGTMGVAIARSALRAGYSVRLVDVNAETLARVQAQLAADAPATASGLTLSDDLASIASSDLVIDAVFEDMAVKKQLLRAVEGLAAPEACIASNTSYLNLDDIASVLDHPERLAGLHFFNPADRNPLVEIICTATSDDRTMATLLLFANRLKKTVIPARVGDGFVANRVYSEYRAQAEYIVEEGADPAQVDAAVEAFGLPMGPFGVGDLSGLGIAWARRKRLAATRDPDQRYVDIADRLCESGRLGRKVGAGWYRYSEGSKRGVADPAVAEIIAAARARKGLRPRAIADSEIIQRIVCAMLVGATVVVSAGVARCASDVDVALTDGFAFPAWRGGPLRYAAAQDTGWLIGGLRLVFESDPIGYQMVEPALKGEIPSEILHVLDQVR